MDKTSKSSSKKRTRWLFTLIGLGGGLFLAVIISATVGAVKIPPLVIFRMLLSRLPFGGERLSSSSYPASFEAIIFNIRLPRIWQGAVVGAALALAGVTFQGLLRNPLADPFILGVSSGAALGASLAIILRLGAGLVGNLVIPVSAFTGALITVVVVYLLAQIGGRLRVETLLLSGVVVSSFLSSLVLLLMSLFHKKTLDVMFWLMGNLSSSNISLLKSVTIFLAVGILVIYLFSRDLNAFALGEESARHLGVEVEMVKKMLFMASSLVTGVAVSVSGLIGFVGLMIPHMVRMLVGPDHRILIPSSTIAGAIFLIIADTIARTVIAPSELPVGIVTAIFGAPFFVYLLRKSRKPESG